MTTTKKTFFIVSIIAILAPIPLYLGYRTYCKLTNDSHVIHSYQELLPMVDTIDKDTLVVFDIDNTLITSPITRRRPWFKALFSINYIELIKVGWDDYFSQLWLDAPFKIIEPVAIELIEKLKDKGVTVLALTSLQSGPYGVIPNMAESRYMMLKKMGIEFSQNYADTTFTNFPEHESSYPKLYKGILFANRQNKGAVLEAFLNYAQLKPKKIIAFENRISKLKLLENKANELGIQFVGYQYIRVKKVKNHEHRRIIN